MGQGILLSADQEVDFMVHGVFSYKWFGHTVWITTTHVCVLIVFLILGIFALCANRAMKHASDVPTGFQNVVEIIVEMLDNMVKGTMGKVHQSLPITSEPYLSLFSSAIFPDYWGSGHRQRIME